MEASSVTGPAKNLLQFAKAARPEIDLSILTFVRLPAVDNAFLEAVRTAGLPITVIPERFRYDPGALAALSRHLAETRPDIVQTHGIKSHFFARFLRRPPLRWIAYHHGYTTENNKVRLYNQLNRLTLPHADRVLTVCEPFAGLLANQGVSAERIHVLPNTIAPRPPVNQERVAALRQSLQLPPDVPILLAVGRFSSEKGHADLLRAFAQLPDSARLVLVGDGILLSELERLAGPRVTFAGHQSDVSPYYALATHFVLPSLSEGSPNVLLEAMAAGLPIVSTRVGGVPETVTDGESALLVPAGDPTALATALRRLLDQPAYAQQLAAAGRHRVATHFSPAQYRQSMLKIYQGALA